MKNLFIDQEFYSQWNVADIDLKFMCDMFDIFHNYGDRTNFLQIFNK
jgi:hypothetical protein